MNPNLPARFYPDGDRRANRRLILSWHSVDANVSFQKQSQNSLPKIFSPIRKESLRIERQRSSFG
jgi:hypothetical protein